MIKKSFFIKLGCIAIMIFCISIQLFGQSHKLHTAKINYSLGIYRIPVDCKAYYDEDDNEIYHNTFSAKDKSDGFEYSISGNYTDGLLDGNLNILLKYYDKHIYNLNNNIIDLGETVLTRSLTASFKNGVPIGEWIVKENEHSIIKNKSINKSYSIKAKYNDGEIESISTSEGSKLTFTLNSIDSTETDSEIVKLYNPSGKWGDETYIKGIITSKFERKNGQVSEPDEETQNILNDISAGDMSYDLIDKGYTVKQYSDITDDIFSDWNYRLAHGGFRISEFNTTVPENGFIFIDSFQNKYRYYAWILKRVKLKSAEEIIELLESKITLDENCIQQIYNNYIGKDYFDLDDDYYFNNIDKGIIIEYLEKRIAEQKKVYSMRDSLRNEIDMFIESYQNYSYLRDEIYSFERICQGNIVYNTEISPSDTTKLKECLSLVPICNDICKNTVDLYQTGKAILSKSRTIDPQLYETYSNIYREYGVECPRTANELESYLQRIIQWNEEQKMIEKYIELYSLVPFNSTKILSSSHNAIVKSYKTAEEANEIKFSGDINKSIENVEAWLAKQNQYVVLDSLFGVALKNHILIAEMSGEDFADVNKNYIKYRKENHIEVTENLEMSIEKANKLISIQDGCINFINEKAKILETDARILKDGNVCKNILKVYKKYMKEVDLTWTETVDIQYLLDIESIQRKFENAIADPNVLNLDKEVKSSKDKSLNTVLDIISK